MLLVLPCLPSCVLCVDLLILSHASRKSLSLFTLLLCAVRFSADKALQAHLPFLPSVFFLPPFYLFYPGPESFYVLCAEQRRSRSLLPTLPYPFYFFPNTVAQIISRTAGFVARYLPAFFLLFLFLALLHAPCSRPICCLLARP